MVYGDIYRNGAYKPCDGRDDRHRIDACKPSVIAVDAAVSCDGRGGGVRPQGGGGVDHPTKVQQRKAQTESRFSLSYYPWISSAKSKSLLQSSLSSLLISFANKTTGGIRYPF